MAFTTSCNTRRRATLAATALAVALLGMETASAAPQTAPFQLAPGHASRPAFYFLVATTGLVSVRVETPMDEPVSVALYAGSTALHHEQGRTVQREAHVDDPGFVEAAFSASEA